ncbi:MAG: hypothetical protein L6R00_07730 [Phycisphaerae bacterium]|nr:hypothetical protein [Phycisphaerae bacterium]
MAVSTNVAEFCHRSTSAHDNTSARVACAPAVVDVMGGLSEWAGCPVLVSPLRTCVVAAARQGSAGRLIVRLRGDATDDARQYVAPIDSLQVQPGGEGNIGALLADLRARGAEAAAPVVAAVQAMLCGDMHEPLQSGLGIEFEVSDGASDLAGVSAALAAVTLEAVQGAFGHRLPRAELLACLERISKWPSLEPGGTRLLLAAMEAQPGRLTQLRRQPQHVAGQIELPAGLIVAAVEVFPRRPIRRERVVESQIAAMMGHRMIVELADAGIGKPPAAYAFLADVTTADFVDHFRDRIPQRISGREYLDLFGPLPNETMTIDPDHAYRPRSRVEHHIYEHQRVQDVMAHLIRAANANDDGPLTKAAELIYASHWSHSQRFGLGSAETDFVSQHVRQQGPAKGMFGAKLASGAYGGLMIVLMRDTPAARNVLNEVVETAAAQYKSPFRVLTGSDAGAAVIGARPWVAVASGRVN